MKEKITHHPVGLTILKTLIIFFLLLTACSAAAPQVADEGAPVEFQVANQEAIEAPAAMEAPAEEVVLEKQAIAPQATPLPSGSGGALNDILPNQPGRMVIKDAYIDLLVEDSLRAADQVTNLAVNQGGYIISSRVWYQEEFPYATIRMAVPSANFENTLTSLRGLGVQVLNETASGQDVSADYNDLQSRLNNLEATAARVRAFLDEAKTVEESLRINATLSDLERQIEEIKGQMKFYEGRSAFSTIEVNLNPLLPTPTPTPTPQPWDPGYTIQQAASIGVDFWQGIIDGLIWICFLGWPLVLVAGIVYLIVRWLRRRKTASVAPPSPPSNDNPE